mmetsp:Transcript_12952/g.28971  ORF Transcript_12952/g.28971 Transcript_12952/m.28971 type:complete len:232 (-) Transcript_12952:724-1419(-)
MWLCGLQLWLQLIPLVPLFPFQIPLFHSQVPLLQHLCVSGLVRRSLGVLSDMEIRAEHLTHIECGAGVEEGAGGGAAGCPAVRGNARPAPPAPVPLAHTLAPVAWDVFSDVLRGVGPDASVHWSVVHENRPVVPAPQQASSSVQALCRLVEKHLSRLQIYSVQVPGMVFDLDGPGVVVVKILVSDVHDGRNHVRADLVVMHSHRRILPVQPHPIRPRNLQFNPRPLLMQGF